jgi:2-haloacid dehalogenase
MRRSIDAIVFDIGGVLLDWNPRYLYRKMFEDEQEMERFLSEVCTPEWHDAHDRGTPFEVSCAELAARYPGYADQIYAWGRRSEEIVRGSIPETVELLRELRDAGVPCYALTNMEVETYPQRVERFSFLRWFDGAVVSGFEGVAKPDVEIFEVLLEGFDLEAKSTLLVDDSPRNVRAALSVGMQAIEFRSASQIREVLVEARVLVAS